MSTTSIMTMTKARRKISFALKGYIRSSINKRLWRFIRWDAMYCNAHKCGKKFRLIPYCLQMKDVKYVYIAESRIDRTYERKLRNAVNKRTREARRHCRRANRAALRSIYK